MKILVYPKDLNPYQELLYTQVRLQGGKVSYLSAIFKNPTINLFLLIPRIIFSRLLGYNIFHLHWTYPFALKTSFWKVLFMQKILNRHYLFCLWVIKKLGYKLVWTAHNVLPHEKIFIDDTAARKDLVKYTDTVIGHSSKTFKELIKIGVVPKKYVVIPHGNYLDVYQNTITKEEARERLGLSMNEFIFLFFGQIRDYKGVDTLVAAYKELNRPFTRLIVAGKCNNQHLKLLLERAMVSHKVKFFNKYISDEEIQNYFVAADVTALPFKSVTTSGSVMLSLSFGKPVIVPNIGDLMDLPETVCYKYDNSEIKNLTSILEKVQQNREELKIKTEMTTSYIENVSWEDIAKRTIKVFKD